MKFTIVLSTIALLLCDVLAKPQEEKYTTKYDNIDIDEILNNARLFNNYVKCLLENRGCTPDGNELKKVLPDALKTECEKCSEIQKANSEKIFKFIYNNQKDVFDRLMAKYDPEGQFKERYIKFNEEQ